MSRKKQHRFEHNTTAFNVIERGKPFYTTIKGKWQSEYFKNNKPLVVELACGKGEYTVGLAKVFPDKNFIGIDIKGDRIARGSKIAQNLGLDNVAFLRTGIQFLEEFFEENEISEIWLIHPDPQPRDKEEKRRLTNNKFLEKYKIYLKNEGFLHLKTDSTFLYEYSMQSIGDNLNYKILEFTDNLYASELLKDHHGIITHYEKIFVETGSTIHYIKSLNIKKAPKN